MQQAARQSLATINHRDIPGLSCRLQEKQQAPRQPNEEALSKQVGPQRL
ncbi:MAG: hypothetical protein HKK67_09145 [Chlorobiaceae bacterium]|nr:hypothetical protein [Chlorobiaceae bacterium]